MLNLKLMIVEGVVESKAGHPAPALRKEPREADIARFDAPRYA